MIQLVSAIPEASGEEVVWGRALRVAVNSVREPKRRATLKALLAGGLWPPARKFSRGLADSNL
eukprot:8752371-Pyramimonas_sp.AAC.1